MRTSLPPLFSEQDITALLNRELSADNSAEPAGIRTGVIERTGTADGGPEPGSEPATTADAWDEVDRSWL